MALHQLTDAELDAVTGGTYVRQTNVSRQFAVNLAVKSNLNTSATASASGRYSDATATASGGQAVVQGSSQANVID